MGGGADIHMGIVQHQVFEVDKLAFESERGAGLGKVLPEGPAFGQGMPAQPFIEPEQGFLCCLKGSRKWVFPAFIRYLVIR